MTTHNNDAIPSPYNFVPLAETVFFPDWAQQVSMDVPFSDGISGTLTLEVTAQTPIYIRNGGAHPEGESRLRDATYTDFFRVTPGGPYAIPGSSVKGMLRAVLEIASFSKIAGGKSAPRVADHRYAVRDLHNPELYTNHFNEKVKGAYQPKVKAAWLSRDSEGKWQLHFCDYVRVEQADLEKFRGENCRLGESGPAEKKYRQIPPGTSITFDSSVQRAQQQNDNVRGRSNIAANLGRGSNEGIIVLTGQPSRRGNRGSKHLEFIFLNPSATPEVVPDSVKKDFEFAHSELGENRKENKEWSFWKPRLLAGERVPVFVLTNGDDIASMGLAFMFRLPYKYSIHDVIAHTSREHLESERLDLAEVIFGRVEDTNALRGRVSVETLVAVGNPQSMKKVLTVLNGPKPTYYPNYVQQNVDAQGMVPRVNGKPQYATFMDDRARISGWKRYLARPDCPAMPNYDVPPVDSHGQQNTKVATAFRPLEAGTKFTGTLHLHNLRKAELGALLWAITWNGDEALRHAIGQGKPYGFGSVTVKITGADLHCCNPLSSEPVELAACQQAFTTIMEQAIPGWERSEQIAALRAMADPRAQWPQEVRYPRLDNGNEFVGHKKGFLALLPPVRQKGHAPKNVSCPAQPQNGERQHDPKTSSESDRPANAQTKQESPIDEIIAGIDRLSWKDLDKKLKAINPQEISPEMRATLYHKLNKKPGSTNFQNAALLKRWSGKS